jgi:hypothetical protein
MRQKLNHMTKCQSVAYFEKKVTKRVQMTRQTLCWNFVCCKHRKSVQEHSGDVSYIDLIQAVRLWRRAVFRWQRHIELCQTASPWRRRDKSFLRNVQLTILLYVYLSCWQWKLYKISNTDYVYTVDPRVTTGLTYEQLGLRPKSCVTTRMPARAKTCGCKPRPEMRS